MTSRNPVLLSERCGVTIAANSAGSGSVDSGLAIAGGHGN